MEYEINGKSYPIIGTAKKNNGDRVPVVGLPLMSDYEWQKGCLLSRLEHREEYLALGEDVDAAIDRLWKYLTEYGKQEETKNDHA